MKLTNPALVITITGLVLSLAGGCTTDAPLPEREIVVATTSNQRPLATVDGARMNFAEIEASLLELGGAAVVRERALDLAVAREATRREVRIDEAAIARERRLLVENLAEDPDRAERILQELRNSRGLGPVRFSGLLRRNAVLRSLIADDVVLDQNIVRGAWDARHGASRVVRIISTIDLRNAEKARARIESGEDFSVVAVETSIDASGPRGGRLAPLSRLDPSWPRAFREAIFELTPGSLSDAMPVDGRILLIEVLEERPADGVPFEAGREEAARVARLAAERLLMDRLARRLAPVDSIEPLDPALRWRLGKDPSGSQLLR